MKVKYLEKRTRSSGKVVWVVNPPKYLREAIGARYEQFDDYEQAVSTAIQLAQRYDDYKRSKEGRVYVDETTVQGLLQFFQTTNEFQKLAENSKRTYRTMIKDALEIRIGSANVTFGEMFTKNVSATHADKFYQQMRRDKSHHRANHTVKVLRRAWFVGMRHGKVRENPWQKMGLEGLNDRIVLWEPEQVFKFIETADAMDLSSVGTIALLCYDLCQRPGDMRQLTWSTLVDDTFVFTQEKTKTQVEVPASPRLLERLGVPGNPDDLIVNYEATGRGYDRRLLAKKAALVRDTAGLPKDLRLSDLRRTGATETAEAGCTEDELRSITGHQSRDVLSIYVRPTRKLARAGIMKRFGN